jgi:hypothetical protein
MSTLPRLPLTDLTVLETREVWAAAARAAGLDDSTRKRIGGSSQADAADGYGWNGALPMLKTAIDKIEFPKVDFSALRSASKGQ